ncbi:MULTISPECIES: lasso peptide biosynthesis B2 protein [unclassified Paenibacillus]|uniref:lasso peptide biosynthesis B2 protein n=1 Tax=unclassified Paenibacillus TaxID=185978 RepID=UPI002F40844A
MLRKLKMLFSLDFKTKLLLIEATLYLGWARFYLLHYPFSKLAASLGEYMVETGQDYQKENHRTLISVHQAIEIMCKYTFWETKCLVRAVTAMKMLEKRRIESTLYLGTAKDETGKLIAHAWLRSGSLYVTGYEEMSRFTITGFFSKKYSSQAMERNKL